MRIIPSDKNHEMRLYNNNNNNNIYITLYAKASEMRCMHASAVIRPMFVRPSVCPSVRLSVCHSRVLRLDA